MAQSNTVIIGNASHGVGGSVSIGNSILGNTPTNGGDITLAPGAPSNGGTEGSIIFRSSDGTEIMRINSQGVYIRGQLFVPSKPEKHACRCSTAQILSKGCICGGI